MPDLQPSPTPLPAESPDSPFARVPTPLRRALEDRGFTELTTVQLAALDAIDASRDLRISSQTGSGKTVALGLAIAPQLVAGETGARRGPEALIIVPTRELAAQVHKELEWLYAAVPAVRIDSVTGGTHVGQERRRLTRKPRILVGTPGRLVDHIGSGALDCSAVGQLVLDEADQMLDMGFREDLDAILAAMPATGRRTHMLSATFPIAVRRLTEAFQTDPLHIEGTRLGTANADIEHIGHVLRAKDRYGAVVNLLLLAGDQRTLIFVATRADAAALAEKLAGDGFSALPLSGDLAQAQRTRTLNAFRAGSVSALVATDVAARGLDVPEVSAVIHGDLPMNGEVYTHRSGRTGRAGRKGRSIMLATPNGERRARRILADSRVDSSWLPAPSATDVERALAKRRRRRVFQAIDDPTTNEQELELARDLLDGRDPERVVATLLAGMRSETARKPVEIEAPAPRASGKFARPREVRPRDARPREVRPRDARSRDVRPREPRPRDPGFTRFQINRGARHGANPSRLLAAICRRGAVSGRVIGAIDIDALSATFDVASDVAREFERRVGRRDARDPDQRIERVADGPRPQRKPLGSGDSLALRERTA